MQAIPNVSRTLATVFMLATTSVAFAADGGDWTVHKSSGEVWLAGSGVQQASLKQEDVLKPGDTVRTGRTGRVLLKRGDEMILISPNSVIGVPAQQKEGLSTTIRHEWTGRPAVAACKRAARKAWRHPHLLADR
jgi:hypothetical protein